MPDKVKKNLKCMFYKSLCCENSVDSNNNTGNCTYISYDAAYFCTCLCLIFQREEINIFPGYDCTFIAESSTALCA
jgi:hypothetical protein